MVEGTKSFEQWVKTTHPGPSNQVGLQLSVQRHLTSIFLKPRLRVGLEIKYSKST